MVAFMKETFTEVFVEASVEAFMESMDDLKASTEIASTEDFMGASVIFRESFHRSNIHESFH